MIQLSAQFDQGQRYYRMGSLHHSSSFIIKGKKRMDMNRAHIHKKREKEKG
jgi:hypothetical protein